MINRLSSCRPNTKSSTMRVSYSWQVLHKTSDRLFTITITLQQRFVLYSDKVDNGILQINAFGKWKIIRLLWDTTKTVTVLWISKWKYQFTGPSQLLIGWPSAKYSKYSEQKFAFSDISTNKRTFKFYFRIKLRNI